MYRIIKVLLISGQFKSGYSLVKMLPADDN